MIELVCYDRYGRQVGELMGKQVGEWIRASSIFFLDEGLVEVWIHNPATGTATRPFNYRATSLRELAAQIADGVNLS